MNDDKELETPDLQRTAELVYLRNAFSGLLDIAEQALRDVDLGNRQVLAFGGLAVLRNAVDYYRKERDQQ